MNSLPQNISEKEFKKLHFDLTSFYFEFPVLFKKLFQDNFSIKYDGILLKGMNRIGLVKFIDDCWVTDILIYKISDIFIITDSFLLADKNRVFPLSNDESLFLSDKVQVKTNDNVLDIGTGSGIYSIIAAFKGATVTAVDINDKALNFAKFNAALNGVIKKITFIRSDIFTDVPSNKYDLIISNPAIIPSPTDSGFYIHSDGGVSGMDMSTGILKDFEFYLSDNGKLKMLLTSFSDINDELVIVKYLNENFATKAIKFSIDELYNSSLYPLSQLTNNFKKTRTYKEFIHFLNEKKYKSLHYLFLTAEKANSLEVSKQKNIVKFEEDAYTGHWNGRLARLFRVYNISSTHKIEKQTVLSL